jgi:hypothetical protein
VASTSGAQFSPPVTFVYRTLARAILSLRATVTPFSSPLLGFVDLIVAFVARHNFSVPSLNWPVDTTAGVELVIDFRIVILSCVDLFGVVIEAGEDGAVLRELRAGYKEAGLRC